MKSIQQPEHGGDNLVGCVGNSNNVVVWCPMVLWRSILYLTDTASRRLGFFASWEHLLAAVAGSSFEAGGSLLYGEDGIRRRHFCVRDGLVGVNNPVVPAIG